MSSHNHMRRPTVAKSSPSRTPRRGNAEARKGVSGLLLVNEEKALDTFRRIQDLGVRVVFDDFEGDNGGSRRACDEFAPI
jgi:predicted signal transduction protein with EAL and GGDEF domain